MFLHDAAEVAMPQSIVHYLPNDVVSHLQKLELLSLTCLIQSHCVIVNSDFCLKEDFKISVMLSNTLQIQLSVKFDTTVNAAHRAGSYQQHSRVIEGKKYYSYTWECLIDRI